MSRAWVVAFVLVAGVYNGPINGDKRDNNFSFSHTSDWKDKQIVNTVQNDHKTDKLVVDWPKGGITRGTNRPLPPNSSDTNRYACPEDLLAADYRAKLYYGLNRNEKIAGVYELKVQKDMGMSHSPLKFPRGSRTARQPTRLCRRFQFLSGKLTTTACHSAL
jgi:hypothetical protein